MKTLLILTIASLIIIGCTSQKKVLNSWLGSTKQNLYQSWGPPDRVTDDANGGEILIYAHQVYISQWNMNYWDYKMMYVHADGTIYYWRTKRQNVPPTQVDVRFLN